jgi:hypothetical protein
MKLLLLLSLSATILSSTSVAEVERSPTPVTTDEPKWKLVEKIRSPSPDGKYALRIMYNAAANEQMTDGDDSAENGAGGERRNAGEAEGEASGEDKTEDGISSHPIQALAIVSLPGKEIMKDLGELTENVFGAAPELLWSSDSKWCAFNQGFPRISHTNVFHLAGDKFKLAHKPDELDVPSAGSVRNVYIQPVRWVKPGVLELEVDRVYRGDEPSEDITGFTASFDGKGKWKVLKKKR